LIDDVVANPGIVLTAYSPLGSTFSSEGVVPLLKNEVVNDIAAEVGRSAAQVVLRWGVQKHITVRPSPCCVVCVRLWAHIPHLRTPLYQSGDPQELERGEAPRQLRHLRL
jgi:hypothetical protein